MPCRRAPVVPFGRYYEAYAEYPTTVTPTAVTVGALCPGSATAICAPLG